MQAQAHSLKMYESVENATRSGREIEAAVLTKAAFKLKECQDNWDAPDRDHKLDEALKYNQRIWSIFQSELSREENCAWIYFDWLHLSTGAFLKPWLFRTRIS